MKSNFILCFLLVLLSSCGYSPEDYYNSAISAGNQVYVLRNFENRLERLEKGLQLGPEDLVLTTPTHVRMMEENVTKLQGKLGNEDSDAMITSAIAYMEFAIETAKNPKTLAAFEAAGNAPDLDAASVALEPYGDYLDSVFDKREAVFVTYDKAVSDFAKKHGIEMKFYGPGASSK